MKAWGRRHLRSHARRICLALPGAKKYEQTIDRFFDDQASYGQPIAGGLLASDTGSRIFALGAYIGEVVRRTYGGHWKGDDSDPLAEIMIELHLPDGRSFQPVHVVIKRLRDASQDGLHLIFQDFSSTI